MPAQTVQQMPTPAPARPVFAAQAPAQGTPAAATRPRARSSKHVSLRSAFEEKADNSTASATVTEAAPRNRKPITAEEVGALWESYAAARPTLHLLVNTMRQSQPALGSDTPENLTVCVENQAQVDVLTGEFPTLLPHLRSGLGNDFITISVTINEGASMPTAWSDRELLAHIVDAHPYAADFLRAFKFTL